MERILSKKTHFENMVISSIKPDYKDFNGDMLKFKQATSEYYENLKNGTKKEAKQAAVAKEKVESIPIPDFTKMMKNEYREAKRVYIESINGIDLNEKISKLTVYIMENKSLLKSSIFCVTVVICVAIASYVYREANRYQFIYNDVMMVDKYTKEVFRYNSDSQNYTR